MISQLSWLQNYCLNELLKEVVDKNSLEEFYQMPRHTVIGHNILSTYNFKSKKNEAPRSKLRGIKAELRRSHSNVK